MMAGLLVAYWAVQTGEMSAALTAAQRADKRAVPLVGQSVVPMDVMLAVTRVAWLVDQTVAVLAASMAALTVALTAALRAGETAVSLVGQLVVPMDVMLAALMAAWLVDQTVGQTVGQRAALTVVPRAGERAVPWAVH